IVKILIDAGASLNLACHGMCKCRLIKSYRLNVDTTLWLPLHLAICQGRDNIAKFLLSRGTSVQLERRRLVTALHAAAHIGNIPLMKYIVENEHQASYDVADSA